MKISRIHLVVAAMLVSLLGAQSAVAQYSLVEDFESYTLGTWNTPTTATAVWTSNTGGGTGLVAIESDGSTQHLAFGWNAGQRGAWRATTPIAEGGSGTYYFQVRSEDATPDVSYGLSDAAAPTGFGDFEVQVGLVDDGDGGNGVFNIIARNGGAFEVLDTGLMPNTWYDVWVVVDNLADTYDVYYGTTGDPSTLGTNIGSGLAFRNGVAANDLNRFWTLANGHEDLNAHLDNIYHNPNAVPEPSALVLTLAAGSLALTSLRRRC